MAVFEVISEKKTRESVVETNICTVLVNCWNIKDTFAGFCEDIFGKKKHWQGILGKIGKKLMSGLADFCHKGVRGRGGGWMNS